MQQNFICGMVKQELHELQVASYDLRVTSWKFKITSWNLQSTSSNTRVTGSNSRVQKSLINENSCKQPFETAN